MQSRSISHEFKSQRKRKNSNAETAYLRGVQQFRPKHYSTSEGEELLARPLATEATQS